MSALLNEQIGIVEPTAYAISQGVTYDVFDRNLYYEGTPGVEFTGAWWWLRSTGSDDTNVAIVTSHGEVYSYGGYVTDYNGVRPAVWVNMDAFERLYR